MAVVLSVLGTGCALYGWVSFVEAVNTQIPLVARLGNGIDVDLILAPYRVYAWVSVALCAAGIVLAFIVV